MGLYNIYMEGQQAEEYLKRKQAQIDKAKEEDAVNKKALVPVVQNPNS